CTRASGYCSGVYCFTFDFW
nr:immunoglobulin heavy chain junction region [Macaca mulatta]MOV38949.1 immunoglobulin heavy chain junction region [Macaca mulatta]MOV39343.1 immunoglobulin heavy chain junction region [Macaca mulatta]MOV39871.1 immunoglobulin heavy chain junction region [Macaca mulatta]MOV40096.1 immunoglobulin heavy chain junction region [Macaca mulatta]